MSSDEFDKDVYIFQSDLITPTVEMITERQDMLNRIRILEGDLLALEKKVDTLTALLAVSTNVSN